MLHPSAAFRPASASKPMLARWALFFALATGVFAADQASKWAAVATLTDTMADVADGPWSAQGGQKFWQTQHPSPTAVVTVHDSYFHLRYVENPGAAWGFLSRSMSVYRTPFFLTLSVFAMGFILVYFSRTTPEQKTLRVALALVFGGAMGNFVDRSRLGYVIDFIDWHLRDGFVWPTFNVADAAISIGVALLLLLSLGEERRARRVGRISV